MIVEPLIVKSFLGHIKCIYNQGNISNRIKTFFLDAPADAYVLFRSGSLYFMTGAINQVPAIERVRHSFTGDYYVRFDGVVISRLDPSYYLGNLVINKSQDIDGMSNNNNNNNNGNNNG